MEDSIFDYEFDDIFAAKYEPFVIDDEPEHDVFEFDDLCSAFECLITFAIEFDSPHACLRLKPLPKYLKYVFLRSCESLPAIIALNLDHYQEENTIILLKQEYIDQISANFKHISPLIVQYKIHLEDNVKPY